MLDRYLGILAGILAGVCLGDGFGCQICVCGVLTSDCKGSKRYIEKCLIKEDFTGLVR